MQSGSNHNDTNVPTKQHGNAQENTMPGERHHPSTFTYDAATSNGSESLTFPWKLHTLMETAANEGFQHIISWLDNDASFKVHQPALFVKHIMPRFFKRQSKYKSFQRQLNIWQFERLIGSKGPCNGGYFHVCFSRHDTFLFHQMRRGSKLASQRTFLLQELSCHSNLDCEYHLSENLDRPNIEHPSESWSNREPASRDFEPSCGSMSGQYVLNMHSMTPYGGCCHESEQNFEEMSIHSDFLNLDSCNHKPQYPHDVARELVTWTSRTTDMNSHSWEHELEAIGFPKDSSLDNSWGDQQVLPSLQIMPDLYVNSHRDDDFDGYKAPPPAKCEEGDSGVLSAEEWKYVLVGMHIAMKAG